MAVNSTGGAFGSVDGGGILAPKPANWYRNIEACAEVSVDIGRGSIEAVAEPLRKKEEISDVLRQVRRKYLAAWIFRILGWNKYAVAARISPVKR